MMSRANCIGEGDAATVGRLTPSTVDFGHPFVSDQSHENSTNNPAGAQGYYYCGTLPSKESHGLPMDLSNCVYTRPTFGRFGPEFGMNSYVFGQEMYGATNPHTLHVTRFQGRSIDSSSSPFQQMFPDMTATHLVADNDVTFDWMTHGFEARMSFARANENAVDDSWPSAMSINSPDGVNDVTGEAELPAIQQAALSAATILPNTVAGQLHTANILFSTDLMPNFGEMVQEDPWI